MSLTLRTAEPGDAQRLLDIYAPYVLRTAVTFEYEVPSLEEFRRRIENILRKYPYLAAEEDGQIVGYAYLSAFHPRAAYGWCAETSVYVDMDRRGRGAGRMLYEELERIAAAQHLTNLIACIAYAPEEDTHLGNDSVRFHEHMGYCMAARLHQCGYKFDTWYDMVYMEKMIGAHKKAPETVTPFPELGK